jgi:hypothetical protein
VTVNDEVLLVEPIVNSVAELSTARPAVVMLVNDSDATGLTTTFPEVLTFTSSAGLAVPIIFPTTVTSAVDEVTVVFEHEETQAPIST